MSNSQNSKWRKVERGFYILEGTNYAVSVSFANSANPDKSGDFIGTPEWATVEYPEGWSHANHTGENLDWFPTMRAAKAFAESLAR